MSRKAAVQAVALYSKHGWPYCAACDAPVAEMLTAQDPITQTLTVSARCHGASETIVVTPEMIEDGEISFAGPAFATQRQLRSAE